MAAPTRNLFGTATTGASNSDTLTVDLSTAASGSQVGDRICVFVASDGAQSQTISSGAGWTKEAQIDESGSAVCLALFCFMVTTAGTVPDLVVDMGASNEMAVAHWFRLRASAGNQVSMITPTTAQGSSTNPNPAAIINNTGATRDIYYLAVWGGDGNNEVSTAAPTNYANHQSTGISQANGSNIGSADRTRTGITNGTSEDPGTFTRPNEQWAALTVGFYESTLSVPGNASGALGATVTSSAMGATATGGGGAGGALSTVTTNALSGAATGEGGAGGALSTVTVTALNGSAGSNSPGNATGAFGGTINVSAMGGTAQVRWTPLQLATLPTHYFDVFDKNTLFNDQAGTIPVGNNNTVRYIVDKGSAAAHASNSGGLHYIAAGGINGRPVFRNNNEAIRLGFTHSFGALTNVQFAGNDSTIGIDLDATGRSSGSVFGTSLMSPHILEIRWIAGTGTGSVGWYLNGSNTPIAQITGITVSDSGHCFLVADCVTGGSQLNFPGNGRYFRAQSTTASLTNQNDGGRPFDGDWGAMLYIKYALSSTELEKIQGSLGHQWGIPLPSGHTYENSPPLVGGAGNASGALAGIAVSSLTGAASGEAAAGGALQTVTLNALTGAAVGEADAAGSLQTITVSALTGTSTGEASASGNLSIITMSALTGGSSVPGDASGVLGGSVILSALGGAAAGQGAAGGALSTVVISSLAGNAAGEGAAAGSLSAVTVTPLTGAAVGAAIVGGALSGVVITAMSGSASGDAGSVPGNASGVLGGSVAISAFGGAAAGQGVAAGALSTIVITSLTGGATGAAQAVGDLQTVTISNMSGAGTGGVNGNATGAFGAVVTCSSLEGSASGAALISNSLNTVQISALTGSAAGGANAVGSLVAILLSALQGTVEGEALASGQLESVSITPMGGIASSVGFGPFTITVRDKRGVERVIGPFIITG